MVGWEGGRCGYKRVTEGSLTSWNVLCLGSGGGRCADIHMWWGGKEEGVVIKG